MQQGAWRMGHATAGQRWRVVPVPLQLRALQLRTHWAMYARPSDMLLPSPSRGNHRKLRVTAQPNVTLSWQHLPARCRRARTLLLGPLLPQVRT